jgi:hypothetical protein
MVENLFEFPFPKVSSSATISQYPFLKSLVLLKKFTHHFTYGSETTDSFGAHQAEYLSRKRHEIDTMRMIFRALSKRNTGDLMHSSNEGQEYRTVSVLYCYYYLPEPETVVAQKPILVSQKEDERVVDVIDVIASIYADDDFNPMSIPVCRAAFHSLLPILPTPPLYLDELCIPYQDFYEFTKFNLLMSSIFLTGSKSEHVDSEEKLAESAQSLCLKFTKNCQDISWKAFYETMNSDLVCSNVKSLYKI